MKPIFYNVVFVLLVCAFAGEVWGQRSAWTEQREHKPPPKNWRVFSYHDDCNECKRSCKPDCRRKGHSWRCRENNYGKCNCFCIPPPPPLPHKDCAYYEHIEATVNSSAFGNNPKIEKDGDYYLKIAKKYCQSRKYRNIIEDFYNEISEKHALWNIKSANSVKIHTVTDSDWKLVRCISRGTYEVCDFAVSEWEWEFNRAIYYQPSAKQIASPYKPECGLKVISKYSSELGERVDFFTIKYRFAVFEMAFREESRYLYSCQEEDAEDCEDSPLIIGEHDPETGKTQYDKLNKVFFKGSSHIEDGTVASLKEPKKELLAKKYDWMQYVAYGVKAVYYCDPGEKFKIKFDDPELVALLKEKQKQSSQSWFISIYDIVIILVVLLGIYFLFKKTRFVSLITELGLLGVRRQLATLANQEFCNAVGKYSKQDIKKFLVAWKIYKSKKVKHGLKAEIKSAVTDLNICLTDSVWETEETEMDEIINRILMLVDRLKKGSSRENEYKRQAEEANQRAEQERAARERAEREKREAEQSASRTPKDEEPEYGTVPWAYFKLKINPHFPKHRITKDFLDERRKDLRKEYHPDPYQDAEDKKEAEEYFKEIDVAYDILMREIVN